MRPLKNVFYRVTKTLALLSIILFYSELQAQCVFTTVSIDSFEYATVIPGYVAGTTYHPSPSTYANAVHSGSRGFYMNFVNGLASNTTVLSRSYSVCTNNQYRFKAMVKEANGGSSTVMFRVKDSNNTILTTYTNTYSAGGVWTLWTSAAFTPTTSTIYFEIIYVSGVGNNDFAMDNLAFEICAPPVINQSIHICANSAIFNMYDSLITPTGTSGIWSGPSTLSNGYLGTFDPASMLGGNYNYSISNGASVACPDSVGSFNVILGGGPMVDFGNDSNLCTGDVLLLDATNDNASYLWQDNSTGSTFSVTQPGQYWVQVSDSCSVVSDTIVIGYNPNPVVNIGNDTTVCNGNILTLDATTPNASYLWSTNSTDSVINITSQGSYWVQVNVNGCSTLDTIQASFAPMPSVNLGTDTTLCQGESIILQANNNNATYLWQNGSTNPILFVNSAGTYWVEATINNCVTSDTINIDFILLPDPNLGNDTALCDGESFTLNGSTPNATYVWQDGSADSTFMVSKAGTYWVAVTNICATIAETIVVTYNPIPAIDLGQDFEICDGLDATLIATTPNASYLWNDNSTSSTLIISESGLYWVQITVKGCVNTDSINADFLPSPVVYLGNDSTICSNQPVTLNATNPFATYLWQDNSTDATFKVNAGGEFWVLVSIGPCATSDTIFFQEIDCEVVLEMPNIFTPNEDAINDLFRPIKTAGIAQMTTSIYSRWGNELFSTSDFAINWNGNDKNGNPAPSGVYYWTINIEGLDGSSKEFQGVVTLTR